MNRLNRFQIFASTLLLLGGLMSSCSSNTTGEDTHTVRLRGQIALGAEQIALKYAGRTSYIGDSRDVILYPNAEGYIDTTLVVPSPSYYSLGRNVLYLTPGDDLQMKITLRSEEAEFAGKGASANTYLKGSLLPKRGSYLDGGRNIQATLEETAAVIDGLVQERLHVLDTLSGVTEEFKKLERARISADVVNAYYYYPMYAHVDSTDDAEVVAERVRQHTETVADRVKPLLRDLVDPAYLDVAVVRNVLKLHTDSLFSTHWFSGLEVPQAIRDFYTAADYAKRVSTEATEDLVAEITDYLPSIEDSSIISELNLVVFKATRLFSGREAIDIELQDKDGNVSHLSDHRGKVIYIDFWATWCGPCLKEAPNFVALSKEYTGQDIVFLSVSIDKDKKAWTAYLDEHDKGHPQYHTSDVMVVQGWGVSSVPRFVLIDKDFNIVEAHAPRPSDDRTKALLQKVIG